VFESGNFSGNPAIIRRNTRYEDGRYSFVGSPVQQNANTIGEGLGSFVFKYNESIPYGSNDGLSRWEVASMDQLIPGTGYTQADQLEITFSGVPNVGEITVNGSYTEDTDDANEGWNLVANPYATAISVADFLAENTHTNGAVYLWDDNGSDVQRGSNADYIVANTTMATATAAGGQSRYNFHLGSAQGFFIKLNDAMSTDIVFTEAMRVEDSNSDENFFRTTHLPLVRLNLTNHDGLFRQTVIGFAEDALIDQLNPKYDASAFHRNAEDGIFTLKAGRSLALNGASSDWEVIQLQLNVAKSGQYAFDIESENFQGTLYLKDNYTGEIIDMTSESYPFSAQPGIHTNRFELLSKTAPLLGWQNRDVQVFAHDHILYLRHPEGEKRVYQLYDLHGRQLLTKEVDQDAELDLRHLRNGIYLVYDGAKTHKILLK
ncbi:MAG: T9SS type A sorting domain-containing protein, partial [Bacteroidota bacterium]